MSLAVESPPKARTAPRKRRRRRRTAGPAWMQSLGGLTVATVVRAWMGTLDCRAAYHDRRVDPVDAEFSGPAVFVFWHEYMLLPLYLRGGCDIAVLASRHRDAEWISQAARRLGFETVRGSGRRGGQAALLEMLRRGKRLNLALACDGPCGPRRKMAPGGVFLASRLQAPLVGLGIGYDSPFRARSWDRFAAPRPWSRARAVVTAPYYVPPEANRGQLEACRQEFEEMLNSATAAAENWAESGDRRPDEVVVRTSRNMPAVGDRQPVQQCQPVQR